MACVLLIKSDNQPLNLWGGSRVKNNGTFKYVIGAIMVAAAFFIGAGTGAFIGEVFLNISDPIMGTFLAVFLANLTSYLCVSKNIVSTCTVCLLSIVFLAMVFYPLNEFTFNYMMAGVFGGILSVLTILLVSSRAKSKVIRETFYTS